MILITVLGGLREQDAAREFTRLVPVVVIAITSWVLMKVCYETQTDTQFKKTKIKQNLKKLLRKIRKSKAKSML